MKKTVFVVFLLVHSYTSYAIAEIFPEPESVITHCVGVSGGYIYDDRHLGEINLSYNYDHYFPNHFIKTMDINLDAGYRFRDKTYKLSYDLKVYVPLLSIGGIHHYKDNEITSNGFTVSLNYTVLQAGYRIYDNNHDEFFVMFRFPLFIAEHGKGSENIFTFFSGKNPFE